MTPLEQSPDPFEALRVSTDRLTDPNSSLEEKMAALEGLKQASAGIVKDTETRHAQSAEEIARITREFLDPIDQAE